MIQRSDCFVTAPGELLRAVEEFNRGEWYQCHETLEELWVGSEGELRRFYQGLLQISAALHHWKNGNFSGAVSLLEKGADCLRHVRAVCQQVDASRLLTAADSFRAELIALGPAKMGGIDGSLLPLLRLYP